MMKTFNRYLLHFGGISLFIMLVFCGFLFMDDRSFLQPIVVLVMWMCVLLFSIPMALLFSSWEKLDIIKLRKELDESDLKKLDDIIRHKYNRTNVYEDLGVREYKMNSRYKAWLTNSIIIEKNENMYCLKIPKAYVNEIKVNFSKYLYF